MVNNILFVFEEDALSFLEGFEEGSIVMDKEQRIKNGSGRISYIGKYSDIIWLLNGKMAKEKEKQRSSHQVVLRSYP